MEQQIAEQKISLTGGDRSLAPKLAAYEKLTLERDMDVRTFYAALVLLKSAIKDMDMKRLYLVQIVEPNLPDYPLIQENWLLY